MPIPHFKRIFSDDYETNKLQSNTQEAFDAVTMSEFIRGNFVNINILTTDTIVEHKLSRTYEGWSVVDIDTNAVIYRSATANPRPNNQIILKASAPCNVKLYIF